MSGQTRAPAAAPLTVYVSNGRGSTVTPIAIATNTAGQPIEVSGGPGSGRGPGSIAITPDGKTAYVVMSGHPTGTVMPIATASNTPGEPIEVGEGPESIAITPDGKTVYVANIGSGTVTPIATATNTPGPPIKVGVRPRAIAITPDGKTAYVANQSRPQPPPWHRFPRGKTRNAARATGPAGHSDPDHDQPRTRRETAIDVGKDPLAIAISPDGKTAYVANTGMTTGGDSTVTPIVTATNTPGPPIQVGSSPWAFAITPDGKTAYVINFGSHSVTPIATATNTPGPPIPVGEGPHAIAITPDGEDRLCRELEAGTVTPIATATNTAGHPDRGRRGSPRNRDHAGWENRLRRHLG